MVNKKKSVLPPKTVAFAIELLLCVQFQGYYCIIIIGTVQVVYFRNEPPAFLNSLTTDMNLDMNINSSAATAIRRAFASYVLVWH